jgi:uncharacterized SAM-binding protein YcdF (DUF218 family)
VVLVVLFAVLYLPFTQSCLTRYLALNTRLERAQAIVVLGGGLTPEGKAGISTAERVLHGVHLLKLGLGEYLVLSGGDCQDGIIEADIMHQLAMEAGVGPDSILTEPNSTDTYENALYTRDLLVQSDMAMNVLLVTSPYHMRRACLCFERQGVVVLPAPVPASEVYEYGAGQNLRNILLLTHELAGLAYYRLSRRL